MKNNNVKKIIVGITIAIFIIGVIVFLEMDNELGDNIFLYFVIGLVILVPVIIGTTKGKTTQIDQSSFEISYKYYRTNFMPIGSIIFTIISLIWLLIEKMITAGTDTAIGFFIGFGLLSFFEFMYRWWKVTYYNGFTFSFSNQGITMSKGSWKKELAWSYYKNFNTVYKAHHGKWVSYIPFLSIFVHKADQYLINLYYTKEHIAELVKNPLYDTSKEKPYDRIPTLPENHDKVLNYIKQYIKEGHTIMSGENL